MKNAYSVEKDSGEKRRDGLFIQKYGLLSSVSIYFHIYPKMSC